MIRRHRCTVLFAAVGAVLVTTACGGAQRHQPLNDEVTTRMTAADERSLDDRHPRDDAQVADPDDDKSNAVQRCSRAMVAQGSDGQVSDPRAALAACADLFERSACRDVHLRAAELPAESATGTIFEQCAREYCPVFDPIDRPNSCDDVDALPADQAQAAWSQLRAAIWRLELDARHRDRLGTP